MQKFDKYYAFHIKLSSPDTPGFNPSHYVIYIRKLLNKSKLQLEFYFASSNAAQDYREWMEKLSEAADKNECRGYAARKYEDDVHSRVHQAEEYLPVGRIQYPDFMVEIVLKKSEFTTDVFFVSGNRKKLTSLYETVNLEDAFLSPYGITLERGPPSSEITDNKLLAATNNISQLIIVEAGDIIRE